MSNRIPSWLYRRPRLLNILHALGLSQPHSQMTENERQCLYKYAINKNLALEIGTYMGVSASIIAKAICENARLFCVDPFDEKKGHKNPCFLMAIRQLKNNRVFDKVTFLLGYSNDIDVIKQIPKNLDFIFIDGDHSYDGLRNDWMIVLDNLLVSGIVCLHDTKIPEEEQYKNFGSVQYYHEVIREDKNFELLETVYSMNVLRRIA
jgi:predicted O-methyltransferase YrrM